MPDESPMTDPGATTREAVEEVLRLNLAALSCDTLPAVNVCADPQCVAVQCLLDRAVRALLNERDAREKALHLSELDIRHIEEAAAGESYPALCRELDRLAAAIRAIQDRQVCATCGHLRGLHAPGWTTSPGVQPICRAFAGWKE